MHIDIFFLVNMHIDSCLKFFCYIGLWPIVFNFSLCWFVIYMDLAHFFPIFRLNQSPELTQPICDQVGLNRNVWRKNWSKSPNLTLDVCIDLGHVQGENLTRLDMCAALYNYLLIELIYRDKLGLKRN